MILVDTSAWVEFDRATGSAVDNRLSGLIAEGAQIAVTEPVVMEVTTGAATPAREQDLRRLLGHCRLLPFDAASRIYRMCRRNGVTPRGLIDCMITSIAHRHGATVLSTDGDLHRIARVVGVPIEG